MAKRNHRPGGRVAGRESAARASSSVSASRSYSGVCGATKSLYLRVGFSSTASEYAVLETADAAMDTGWRSSAGHRDSQRRHPEQYRSGLPLDIRLASLSTAVTTAESLRRQYALIIRGMADAARLRRPLFRSNGLSQSFAAALAATASFPTANSTARATAAAARFVHPRLYRFVADSALPFSESCPAARAAGFSDDVDGGFTSPRAADPAAAGSVQRLDFPVGNSTARFNAVV